MERAHIRLRLRPIRKARGLSQYELARRVGCTVAFISRLEAHHSLPSIPTLATLAQVLAVPPWDLVEEAVWPYAACPSQTQGPQL